MTSTKMTIRKANADRKLIDSQINKIINDIKYNNFALIGIYQSNKPLIGMLSPKEYEEQIKSNWQKINDLLIRREKLNFAVMKAYGGFSQDGIYDVFVQVPKFVGFDKSSSETQVLTIAQAIARKNLFKDTILNLVVSIQQIAKDAAAHFEKMTNQAHKDMLDQINKQFGPESSQTAKQRIEYTDSIKDQYIVNKIDPLNLYIRISDIKDNIMEYINNIDSILSKATETTEVEVED